MKSKTIQKRQHSTKGRRKPSDVDTFAEPLTADQDAAENFDNVQPDFFDQTAELFAGEDDFFDVAMFDGAENATGKKRRTVLDYMKQKGAENKARKQAQRAHRAAIAEQQRKEAEKLAADAQAANLPVETVALARVNDALPQIQGYITANGQQPQSNPAAAALQAANIIAEKVEAKQQTIGGDPDTVYESVLQDEQDLLEEVGEENGIENPDEFLGGLIASVVAVGKKVIGKINEKRKKKGKKPAFQGPGWQAIGQRITGATPELEAAGNALTRPLPGQPAPTPEKQGIVSAGIGAFKKDQTRQALNQYMPFIIIGVALLLIIGFMTGKKSA